MSDPGDLLRKTDALLGRYRGAVREAQPDFPVLTEIVSTPHDHSSVPGQSLQASPDAGGALLPDAEQLKRELEKVVTDSLASQLPQILERRLESALSELMAQLPSLIEAAVTEAV